ncbi:DUF885 domain-containing protein [Sphingomonas sp. PL-96]|uniref:DUF885 domain-containing protein n=1 Tax=Sphingomonas sp. PL-96 TaxID=2887201 RepID=UPI001E57701A|nr:DUF885 domain-containing protein [Sphingomonas sp. PL-96]MCC2977835.1 DUF885 domain-containing protein [Sphingomonas sp. PL-96]
MRSGLFALLLLAGATLPGSALVATPAAPAAAPAQDAAFEALGKRFLDEIARLRPTYATFLGDHRFDAEVDDLSAAGRAREVAALKRTQADLTRIDRSKLSRENQVDAALLANELAYQLWTIETLKPHEWDPQGANESVSGGLYLLAARDFAPWPQRLRAATARMEKVPALYRQMRASLVPARVPEVFAKTVSQQNSGVLQIAEAMLAPHKGELPAADQQRFDAALATLKTAVADQQKWLDTVLVPQAKGDFRLGAERYDQKLRFALVTDLTRADIKARALKAKADARGEMYAIARTVLAGKPNAPALPASPTADQQQQAIEAALELTYARHPTRDGVIAEATKTLRQATEFTRAKNLVSVPDTPVQIIEMPKFRQGVAVAYCDSPGPFEKQLGTFFAVSPIPAGWSEEQANSFLREYNDYMIHDLSVHEAMPGHYLQIAHANEYPSMLRAVLASGPFIEGWAVYAEGMMADQGYLNGDPLFKLTVLKMRLRSITNTLLDIGIHTEGMTEAQAMQLMMQGAFQQEREAAGKWTRARLSSTQLLSYFVGYSEHQELRAAVEAREGAAFDLKRYNDAVLAHGSPPVRYVRALMLGEAIH